MTGRSLCVSIAVVSLCLAGISCGADTRKATSVGHASKKRLAPASHFKAGQAGGLVPRQADFGAGARVEGQPLAAPVLARCNLRQLLWKSATSHAAAPLVRKGRQTYLALVGVFNSRAAAERTYASLVTSAQQRCYTGLVRGGYISQIGRASVTNSQVDVMRRRSSSLGGLALEIRTRLHFPSRDYDSNAKVGILRQSNAVYLMANFGWGRRSVNALSVFTTILTSRTNSL